MDAPGGIDLDAILEEVTELVGVRFRQGDVLLVYK